MAEGRGKMYDVICVMDDVGWKNNNKVINYARNFIINFK